MTAAKKAPRRPKTVAEKEKEQEREKQAQRERRQLAKLVDKVQTTRSEGDVLMFLVNTWLKHRHAGHGEIHPGVSRIARGARVSERTAQRVLRNLERAEIIMPCGERLGRDGKATEYLFNRVALHRVAISEMNIRDFLAVFAEPEEGVTNVTPPPGDICPTECHPVEESDAPHCVRRDTVHGESPSDGDETAAPPLVSEAPDADLLSARRQRRAR